MESNWVSHCFLSFYWICVCSSPAFAQTHLGGEVLSSQGRVVLAVASHVSTADLLDGHVFHVEANIVSGKSFRQRLMVHLHRLHLSGQVGGGKGDDHTRLQDTSLNTADGDSSNTWERSPVCLQSRSLKSGEVWWTQEWNTYLFFKQTFIEICRSYKTQVTDLSKHVVIISLQPSF